VETGSPTSQFPLETTYAIENVNGAKREKEKIYAKENHFLLLSFSLSGIIFQQILTFSLSVST